MLHVRAFALASRHRTFRSGLSRASHRALSTSATTDRREAEAPAPANIKLYQYAVCPYCCATKAHLQHLGLSYSTIEVNPLTKNELKPLRESSGKPLKRVPVAVFRARDGEDGGSPTLVLGGHENGSSEVISKVLSEGEW